MERGLLTVSSLSIVLIVPLLITPAPLQFGAGHRSCLGKNISLLEIYKLVPTILQTYDVSAKLLSILLDSGSCLQ